MCATFWIIHVIKQPYRNQERFRFQVSTTEKAGEKKKKETHDEPWKEQDAKGNPCSSGWHRIVGLYRTKSSMSRTLEISSSVQFILISQSMKTLKLWSECFRSEQKVCCSMRQSSRSDMRLRASVSYTHPATTSARNSKIRFKKNCSIINEWQFSVNIKLSKKIKIGGQRRNISQREKASCLRNIRGLCKLI